MKTLRRGLNHCIFSQERSGSEITVLVSDRTCGNASFHKFSVSEEFDRIDYGPRGLVAASWSGSVILHGISGSPRSKWQKDLGRNIHQVNFSPDNHFVIIVTREPCSSVWVDATTGDEVEERTDVHNISRSSCDRIGIIKKDQAHVVSISVDDLGTISFPGNLLTRFDILESKPICCIDGRLRTAVSNKDPLADVDYDEVVDLFRSGKTLYAAIRTPDDTDRSRSVTSVVKISNHGRPKVEKDVTRSKQVKFQEHNGSIALLDSDLQPVWHDSKKSSDEF